MDPKPESVTTQKYKPLETMIQNLTVQREERDKKLSEDIERLRLEREQRYKELTAMLHGK